jgi:ABC-type Zn uptake system ZnuABC Zn-binding protein ZnuA
MPAFRKPAFLILGIAAALLIAAFLFFREPAPAVPESNRKSVAVTIYPLYDIVRNVAGEFAAVQLILPPGASPHLFEFSPKQLGALQNISDVFAIGHGLDNWAAQVTNVVKGARVCTVDAGIPLRTFANGSVDPHYWLHFGNARQIADNIAIELGAIDPAHSDAYRKNAKAYKKALTEKEDVLKSLLAPARGESILTFHDAWFYFAQDFGLNIVGSFEPAAGVEPTPRSLEALQTEVRARQIHVIFIEPQLSTSLLEGFAKDNHLGVARLDPLGGVDERTTYLDLMTYNANAIRQAVAGREH